MRSHSTSAPVLGGTSLLVIFGVLCLTVFSLLTLTTAQAQQRISQSAARSASGYYEADYRAERIFARLRGGELPEEVRRDGDIYSYSIPISPHQTLQVQLQRTEEGWQILRWQACLTGQPETDQTLSLWDGTTPQEVSP